jgi:nitroreductase
MELRDILRRRRMVRHYTGEPVPRETLERIVAAVRRAPSAIPDELRIVAGVTLGHGAPDPEWSRRTSRATQRRRELDELVHWNAW